MERNIIINQQPIKLTITYQHGICFPCQKEKEINLISYKQIWMNYTTFQQTKKYCWSCALNSLYKLEWGDYQVANKEQVIKELREELNKISIPLATSEIYYSCKNCSPNTKQTLIQHLNSHKWFVKKDNWPEWKCKDKNGSFSNFLP